MERYEQQVHAMGLLLARERAEVLALAAVAVADTEARADADG